MKQPDAKRNLVNYLNLWKKVLKTETDPTALEHVKENIKATEKRIKLLDETINS